jgi:TatA/E family protein of Tat protein translocase
MFGLSPAHLLIIIVIALVVVGPGKLPEVGAAIGKSVREFQKATGGLTGGLTETLTGTLSQPQAPQPAQPAQPAQVAQIAQVAQPAAPAQSYYAAQPVSPVAVQPVYPAPVVAVPVQYPVMTAVETVPTAAAPLSTQQPEATPDQPAPTTQAQ